MEHITESDTIIRAYETADKMHCLNAFKSNVPLFFTEGEVLEFESFLDNLSAGGHQDNKVIKTHFFVVVYRDKVIGCGGFGDKDHKQIISLAWGLIHIDFHKKGFGKKLLQYRLVQISMHYPACPVVVDTTQFCHLFFEKKGFHTLNITPDFYTVGMHRYDMILKKE